MRTCAIRFEPRVDILVVTPSHWQAQWQALRQGGKVVTLTGFLPLDFGRKTLFFQRDLEGGQEGTEKGRKLSCVWGMCD